MQNIPGNKHQQFNSKEKNKQKAQGTQYHKSLGTGEKKKKRQNINHSIPPHTLFPKNINTLPQESHFKNHLQKDDSPQNHQFPTPALCGPMAQYNIQFTSTSIKYYKLQINRLLFKMKYHLKW